ncbi:MAG TPA: Kiwa anti-phage protein KwaB-like domain-containing protein [Methanotrichaceae archaeon]|nr:Kiwa anti-phage protein KwaB-like domain-containing protein [Methanotrichaceae archaeon]
MDLNFDLNNIRTIEFGIGLDENDGQRFCCMVVDANVQRVLREMAVATRNTMCELDNDPPRYDPSEKYEASEYVQLPLDDELARRIQDLHKASNLPIDSTALADPSKIFCYFARMTDAKGRRLTALRRAVQFKGILKNRLICVITDALKLIEDKVFKLDKDFDLLIDASHVHILRPSAFEFAGNLQEAVLAAVPRNISAIQGDLTFVDLAPVQDYACRHPRAARYLASIRSQKQTENIDKGALKEACMSTGVGIEEVDDVIIIREGQVIGFLEVLDRRRYEVELVKNSSEQFRATSRRKIIRGRS